MITIKGLLIGFFTGVLLTVGWVIFIDGQITTHDAFPATHVIAPILTTFSAVMINLVSKEQVEEKTPVKVWLFFWFTGQAVCIGAAIFILSTQYPAQSNYPGVTLLLQTIITLFATLLFFLGK